MKKILPFYLALLLILVACGGGPPAGEEGASGKQSTSGDFSSRRAGGPAMARQSFGRKEAARSRGGVYYVDTYGNKRSWGENSAGESSWEKGAVSEGGVSASASETRWAGEEGRNSSSSLRSFIPEERGNSMEEGNAEESEAEEAREGVSTKALRCSVEVGVESDAFIGGVDLSVEYPRDRVEFDAGFGVRLAGDYPQTMLGFNDLGRKVKVGVMNASGLPSNGASLVKMVFRLKGEGDSVLSASDFQVHSSCFDPDGRSVGCRPRLVVSECN